VKPPLFNAIATAFEAHSASTVAFPSVLVPGRWAELQVDPTSEGAHVRFRDITSQVLAEQSPSSPDALRDPNIMSGPAEIVLLDKHGVIRSANAAWRASMAEHVIKFANDGVGARYVDVCKAALGGRFDEAAFQHGLDELLDGRVQQFGGSYGLEGPHGRELRHVDIAPLPMGRATFFIATHEDLTGRARVLASLNETSDQLLHAQESERQRIAIELHDTMSQHLVGLALGLGNLRKLVGEDLAAAQELIDELATLTRRAIRETRVLSYLMNASNQGRQSLKATVQRFVDGFGSRTGLKTAVEAEGLVDAAGAAVQHAVFRVIQEALTNVYRHARATKVAVSLVAREGMLTVRIADDGHGIQPARAEDEDEAPLGVGIPGMRSRMEQLGGTLDIKSVSDAAGAVVTAKLPLRPRA
jgi:signal transduction histidine kinase